MTAVRGPFVFTSDRFQDEMIVKAKQAGCKSLALQLGAAPADAADKVRAAGLQVIGWGACSGSTHYAELAAMKPSVWMPQAESTSEFNAMVAAINTNHIFPPCEPVMTSAGMETEKPNATPAEKVAERKRRSELLKSFGVTKVWSEVYLQDAHRPGGNTILGDVNAMCAFFTQDLGFEEAHPVLGLWTVDAALPWAQNPYSVSKYDLGKHGRMFGAWRAEQMADARYAEMAAVPDVVVPPVPPPPPPLPKMTTAAARAIIEVSAEAWERDNGGPKPFTRITLAKRIASKDLSDAEWKRQKVGEAISLLLDQAEAIE